MINEGIKTAVLNLESLVADPAASDEDIVNAMRLPADLSVETLAIDEMKALAPYLDAWSRASDMDTRELFLRNTACKRALYISAPIFLPDTIWAAELIGSGVNERIHVYEAPDMRDTIRLEAVSSYHAGRFRFRYALSIQYMHDSTGLGWQLIRPVVILDRELLAAVAAAGGDAPAALARVVESLRRLIALGSHDYIHGTVLNWFPPPLHLSPAYAAMMTERPHPPEIDGWHAGSQTPLPADLVPGVETPLIATLELYSLMAHAQVIGLIWDGGRLESRIRQMMAEFGQALEQLLRTGAFAGDDAAGDAAGYFMTLAGWFLVSALPLGSDHLAKVLDDLPGGRVRQMTRRLAEVHGGMFAIVRLADPDRFPWLQWRVPLREVAADYARALAWPALRTHAGYLTRPRRDDATAPAWLEVLCAGQPPAGTRALLDVVTELRELGPGEHRLEPLLRLRSSGGLELLRSVSQTASPANGAGAGTAPLAYARAILASLVAVADGLLCEVGDAALSQPGGVRSR
jgi:hypothetical protein